MNIKPKQTEPIIVGIETSCDETAVAITLGNKLLAHKVATQLVHTQYGGVVPELASRDHDKVLAGLYLDTLRQANIQSNDISAIAYTQGPGLLGALLVGHAFGKSLAYALGIPSIGVHHMRAHILAHMLEDSPPQFPFLCLTVSGGHTQIVKVLSATQMEVLGETLDDAAGEAFDKGAKMLGLPYPGGPIIDKLAATGNEKRFEFNSANMPNLDFSFSGVKTSLLYFLKKHNQQFINENINDIAASYQAAIVESLIKKVIEAQKITGINRIAIAGGVAANKKLRNSLKQLTNTDIFIPRMEYCTDNAAMIAISGYYLYLEQKFSNLDTVPDPRLPF